MLNYLIVFHLVYITIIYNEVENIVFFPDLLYFALEHIGFTYPLKVGLAIRFWLYAANEIITTQPYGVVMVEVNNGYSRQIGRVYDTPCSIVVVKQTLEVGYKCKAVRCRNDIEIEIVRIIFLSRNIQEVRYTLCPCGQGQQ